MMFFRRNCICLLGLTLLFWIGCSRSEESESVALPEELSKPSQASSSSVVSPKDRVNDSFERAQESHGQSFLLSLKEPTYESVATESPSRVSAESIALGTAREDQSGAPMRVIDRLASASKEREATSRETEDKATAFIGSRGSAALPESEAPTAGVKVEETEEPEVKDSSSKSGPCEPEVPAYYMGFESGMAIFKNAQMALPADALPDICEALFKDVLKVDPCYRLEHYNDFCRGVEDAHKAAFGGMPGQAKIVSPVNASTGLRTNVVLVWRPGSGALTHNINYGSTNPPPAFAAGLTTVSQSLSGLANGRYYWSVDAVNASGVTRGPVWEFTVGP